MLKAILGGKGRRLPMTAKPGDSYRSVFRGAEDLLTAATFSRLAYLDPARFWDILFRATRGGLPAQGGCVRLKDVDFWPGWLLTTVEGVRSVEPDVFLSFEFEGSPSRFDLIVECKRWAGHSRDQWVREWHAHIEAYPDEDIDREVALLAVGRWGRTPSMEAAMIAAAGRLPMPAGFRVVALGWGDLVDALTQAEVDGRDKRIVADILDALTLHGYLHASSLSSLAGPSVAGTFPSSLATFAALVV